MGRGASTEPRREAWQKPKGGENLSLKLAGSPRAGQVVRSRDVVAAVGQLTPAVISFPAKEQWHKNKCSPPLSRLPVHRRTCFPRLSEWKA